MGHKSCFEFGHINLTEEDIKNKSVLEIGASSMDGGSMRPFVETFCPKDYIGIDLQMAPGVDELCDAYEVIDRFGCGAFDLLIANELLEHIQDWRRVISNFKKILRPNGVLLITTRSKGFRFHLAPFDFWRYELSDMRVIFSDFIIEKLETDPQMPGVFIKARKPVSFIENDLTTHKLYSIIKNERVLEIKNGDICLHEVQKLGLPYFIRFCGIPYLLREYLQGLRLPLKRFLTKIGRYRLPQ